MCYIYRFFAFTLYVSSLYLTVIIIIITTTIIIYHHHHHHLPNMQLFQKLTRSVLTYPEVSLTVSPGSFCLPLRGFFSTLGIPLTDILFVCCNRFLLHSCILCKTGLYLVLLQSLSFFLYNLSKCFLLFFSYIAFLLLLFFLPPHGAC